MLRFAIVLIFGVCIMPARAETLQPGGLKATDRVVFMGDSITDGFTYPLQIQQSLREAGKPVFIAINAGIGGDTAEGMAKRVDRDVLIYKPALVTLSVGINDILHGVTPELYKERVKSISDQLKKAGVPMMILTTTILGSKHAEKDKKLDEYNTFLRALAKENGYWLADVNALMHAARTEGKPGLMSPDDVHLEMPGYDVMARAVMDGLGYKDVPLTKNFVPPAYPGLIKDWKFKLVDGKVRVDEKSVADIKPDADWLSFTLPDSKPAPEAGWWPEHERQRGAAMTMERELGKSKLYLGYAEVDSDADKKAFINVGSYADAVWLNGKRVYKNDGQWRGWHLGRERMPIELKKGKNVLVMETGAQWLLSITDNCDW